MAVNDGNAARIRDKNVQNQPLPINDAFAICPTINTLAILRYLCGSEIVLLGVVIGKCETPTTNISQENGHGILMIEFQFVPYN